MFSLLILLCSSMSAQCPNVNTMYQDLVSWRNSNIQHGFTHNVIKAQITIISPEQGGSFHTAWGKSLLVGFGPCNLITYRTVFIKSDEAYTNNSGVQHFSNKTEHIIKERTITLDMVSNRITVKTYLPSEPDKIFSNLTRVGDVIYGTNSAAHMIILNFKKDTFSGNIEPIYRTLEPNVQ